jgi:hypothetical protein
MLGCGGGVGVAPPSVYFTGLQGWTAAPLFTVGDSFGGYLPPGNPDGLVLRSLDADTVRLFVNHELPRSGGYAYTLANGLRLRGARISAVDIDRTTREVVAAGLAYDTIRDRAGAVVTQATQVNEGTSPDAGLAALCSSQGFVAGERGFTDDVVVTGEESGNGTHWALEVATRTLWAAPALGRGSWENVCALATPCSDRVALLMGDDHGGAPLYLWIGEVDAGGGFLARNGLETGRLYVWAADNGDTTPQQLRGLGAQRAGRFVAVEARVPGAAGQEGHDAAGWRDAETLRDAAFALGAFSFARPEDVHTDPADGSRAVFAATGRGTLHPADDWGTVYVMDVDFAGLACGGALPSTVPAVLSILLDADEAPVPDLGVRNPDNVLWSSDGGIYVQENRAVDLGSFGSVSGRDASLWQVDPLGGAPLRIGEVDQGRGGVFGAWESSGVIDVTDHFDVAPGERLLLLTVMAHTVKGGTIAAEGLHEGGQVLFLAR